MPFFVMPMTGTVRVLHSQPVLMIVSARHVPQTTSLEHRVLAGMLGEEPGGTSRFVADQVPHGPAAVVEHSREPAAVVEVKLTMSSTAPS
jgi:hypothetical protein